MWEFEASVVCCFASRPATIPAAFIQSALNGPQQTRTSAVSVPHLALAAFKAKLIDPCSGLGIRLVCAMRHNCPSANQSGALHAAAETAEFKFHLRSEDLSR